MWSPRFAFLLAATLAGAGAALLAAQTRLAERPGRLARRAAPYLVAAGGVIALYGIWQVTLDALVVHTAGAVNRGRWIVHVERDIHLPSEASLQRLALHATWLVKASNKYYADVDFPALCACLAWLFARHRERFARFLVTLVVATGICSVIQAIPVAPPRLVPGFGFIDTAQRFHQLVYSPGGGDPGVLTTMPSVHVAWAAYVAVVVGVAGTSRWRWVFIAHPVLTSVVVVVTGNHFWADGIVALAILGATVAGQAGVGRWWGRTSPRPLTVPRPGPVGGGGGTVPGNPKRKPEPVP